MKSGNVSIRQPKHVKISSTPVVSSKSFCYTPPADRPAMQPAIIYLSSPFSFSFLTHFFGPISLELPGGLLSIHMCTNRCVGQKNTECTEGWSCCNELKKKKGMPEMIPFGWPVFSAIKMNGPLLFLVRWRINNPIFSRNHHPKVADQWVFKKKDF